MRTLCSILLAATFGVTVLVFSHHSSQSQTFQDQEGVEAWLPIPYPRTPDTGDGQVVITDAELALLMDEAKSAGADGVDMQADWWIIEPQDNSYRWSYTDRFVQFAEARGLKVGFQITAAPPFARQSGGDYGMWDPPRTATELGYWHDFIFDLVSRYGTRVFRYEMWNEPDHPTFWKPERSPAEYAALMREGYLAAKAANPSVRVTCCALSGNDIGFLEAVYAETGKYADAEANDNYFDELSVHPYSFAGSTQVAPDDPEHTFQGVFGLVNSNFWGYRKMRDILVDHGDSHKKIYIGEFGYSTKPSWTPPITDEQRAVWLKKAFEIANQSSGYLSGLEWYSYYSDTGRGFNIFDLATDQKTLTFKALAEVAGGPTSGSVETLTFSPSADVRVYQLRPDTNYGRFATLIADGGTGIKKRSYLKFAVSGLNGRQVRSAFLRVFVRDGGGSNDGPGVRLAGNTWSEKGVTWNNRPDLKSGMVADQGSVPGGAWVNFDVTSLVRQDGTVTLAVAPTSTDGIYMSSREDANKPNLVVTVGS